MLCALTKNGKVCCVVTKRLNPDCIQSSDQKMSTCLCSEMCCIRGWKRLDNRSRVDTLTFDICPNSLSSFSTHLLLFGFGQKIGQIWTDLGRCSLRTKTEMNFFFVSVTQNFASCANFFAKFWKRKQISFSFLFPEPKFQRKIFSFL